MSDMIELHAKVDENGKLTIHDQDGRRLAGVRMANMVTRLNTGTELQIECLQYIDGVKSADNTKHVKRNKRTPPPTTEYVTPMPSYMKGTW
jgi:phage replication-related protein YjqB (UPF0714/DUF867 family)